MDNDVILKILKYSALSLSFFSGMALAAQEETLFEQNFENGIGELTFFDLSTQQEPSYRLTNAAPIEGLSSVEFLPTETDQISFIATKRLAFVRTFTQPMELNLSAKLKVSGSDSSFVDTAYCAYFTFVSGRESHVCEADRTRYQGPGLRDAQFTLELPLNEEIKSLRFVMDVSGVSESIMLDEYKAVLSPSNLTQVVDAIGTQNTDFENVALDALKRAWSSGVLFGRANENMELENASPIAGDTSAYFSDENGRISLNFYYYLGQNDMSVDGHELSFKLKNTSTSIVRLSGDLNASFNSSEWSMPGVQSHFNQLNVQPGETRHIRIRSHFAQRRTIKEYELSLHGNTESGALKILVDDFVWHALREEESQPDSGTLLNNDPEFENHVADFDTRYPTQVQIFTDVDNVIAGEASLGFELSPWRQMGFTKTYPWAQGPYADKLEAKSLFNLLQAKAGSAFQLCSRVYYLDGTRDERCDLYRDGEGQINYDSSLALNPEKQIWRVYFTVRSYASQSVTGVMDSFYFNLFEIDEE